MLMLILLLVMMLALRMLIGLHVCIRLRRAHSILFLRVVALVVVVMVILGMLLVVLPRVERSGRLCPQRTHGFVSWNRGVAGRRLGC